MTSVDGSLASALVAALPDGVLVIDPAGVVVGANRAAGELLGFDAAALIGRGLGELYFHPEEAHERTLADRTGVDGRPTPREWRTQAGARRVLLVSSRVIGDQVALVLRDPGDLEDMVERLLRSADGFRAVIDSAPDCVIIHTRGRVTYANRTMLTMWGGSLDELIGMPALQVVHPDDHPLARERMAALAAGKPLLPFIDERLVRKDGTVFLAQVGAVAIAFDGEPAVMVVARDVTELRRRQLRGGQIDRMVALGTLAAGVAHEIGNPITGIACLAQNLREERADDSELNEMSTQILEQTKRVSRIVQSLMNFAHAGGHQHAAEAVCLADVAQDAISLLALNRNSVDVQFFNLCDPQHLVTGDAQRLAQVLINLLSNARDASQPGGAIRVKTEANEDTVELLVEDEGSGIPKAIMDRLFEPFFTTKDPGQGTGLGLALVYSIVEEHYGQITIDSPADPERQRGTRFRVKLPRHVEATSAVN